MDRLIEAARKRERNGARDAAAILLAYRHGLRAAELCSLRWSQIDLAELKVCILYMVQSCEHYDPYRDPANRQDSEGTIPGPSPHAATLNGIQARQSR